MSSVAPLINVNFFTSPFEQLMAEETSRRQNLYSNESTAADIDMELMLLPTTQPILTLKKSRPVYFQNGVNILPTQEEIDQRNQQNQQSKMQNLVSGLTTMTFEELKDTKSVHKCSSKAQECIICTDDFDQKATVSLLDCGHVYHPSCIQKWLESKAFSAKKQCPICRNEIKKKIMPVQRTNKAFVRLNSAPDILENQNACNKLTIIGKITKKTICKNKEIKLINNKKDEFEDDEQA